MPTRSAPPLRFVYAGAAAATMGLGLLVNRGNLPLSAAVRDIAGDMLWAIMMLWFVSLVRPTATRMARAGMATAVCWIVEMSQLLHWEWLVAMRAHPLGYLVLGSAFDARDLLAYMAGIAVAVLLLAASAAWADIAV